VIYAKEQYTNREGFRNFTEAALFLVFYLRADNVGASRQLLPD
jgi:hypothetical protein